MYYTDIDSVEDLENAVNYIALNFVFAKLDKPTIAFIAPMTEFRNTVSFVFKNIMSLKDTDVINLLL